LCFLLGRQHIGFKLRRSALLKKEEAVSKGEVEKCASAIHNLGHYRQEGKSCQELKISHGFSRD
jgi:hypothetical protein